MLSTTELWQTYVIWHTIIQTLQFNNTTIIISYTSYKYTYRHFTGYRQEAKILYGLLYQLISGAYLKSVVLQLL